MDDQACFETHGSNPLEALMLAHRENVHSAMLAWLLGSRHLPVNSRRALLRAIVGIPDLPAKEITARTEWDDLDILVEVTGDDGECAGLVAIEHKLKAGESETQLERYDKSLAVDGRRTLRKVFLSFIGDSPRGGSDWTPASYDQLLDGLNSMASTTSNQYARDYRDVVWRLNTCKRLVTTSREHAAYVFERDSSPAIGRGFADYVEASRLRVTLQRVWLSELAKQVEVSNPNWLVGVGETNGAGLLNVYRRTRRNQCQVEYGVQVQRGRFKAFVQPAPYLKSTTEPERAAVEGVLAEIKGALGLGADIKATNDRGRGFRSFRIRRATSTESPDLTASAALLRQLLNGLEQLVYRHGG